MLAARVRDYHAKGLAGIAGFDRGGGEVSSLGEDLRLSTLASESFRKVLPRIHRALMSYPSDPPRGGTADYFWSRISIQGRPVFLLTQRLGAQLDGRSVVIERRFYSTQFMGAGQTIALLVAVQEGTLFAYADHSVVDRWSGPGFVTPGKRKLGLKIAEDTMRKAVERSSICEGAR